MKKLFLLFIVIGLAISLQAQTTFTLKADTSVKVGGLHIVCAQGTQMTMQDGHVVRCTPKNDFSFVSAKQYKYIVSGGEPVTFYQNGNIISFTLKHNAVVETASGQHYSALAGYMVELYPDGSVKRFTPKFMISVPVSESRTRTWPAKKEIEFSDKGFVVEK